jgi:sugar phosphate isomerase/epimerase
MAQNLETLPYPRRQFVRNALSAAAIVPLGAAVAAHPVVAHTEEVPPAPSAGRARVGCTSWVFHGFNAGADPTEAIERIGEMGFEGIELILNDRSDIKDFWTAKQIGDIKKRLEKHRLVVSQFVMFQPVVEGLTSTDADQRKRNLDFFEQGCRIGRQLDAPMVNFVAPWPPELHAPGHDYLPRYYDLPNPNPGQKFHVDIAAGFDWDTLWRNFVEMVKACLERVKRHGMKLSIEHHTHTMINDATAFLRLWDAVREPALGYNLDAGWTLLQREYPPVAIHKLGRRLMNAHIRDIDGLMRRFVHIGEGVMDFRAIAAAIKASGFTGFLNLEQDKEPGDMGATCRRYLAMMKEFLD